MIALSTYFSFKYSMNSTAQLTDNKEMANQMNSMTTIMVIMITLTSFSLSTALAFYWIVTYAFIAVQTFIFKRLSNDKRVDKDKKNKNNKKKRIRRGIRKYL